MRRAAPPFGCRRPAAQREAGGRHVYFSHHDFIRPLVGTVATATFILERNCRSAASRKRYGPRLLRCRGRIQVQPSDAARLFMWLKSYLSVGTESSTLGLLFMPGWVRSTSHPGTHEAPDGGCRRATATQLRVVLAELASAPSDLL